MEMGRIMTELRTWEETRERTAEIGMRAAT